MPKPILSAKAIFDLAVERPTLAERLAYLDEVCADAPELRRKVEALLKAHEEAGSFLENPALTTAGGTLEYLPLIEGLGTIIGPYKLLQQIGEGGFGVVFMAEQEKPVRRRVALKIIKPGMDTAQVIARFESERQALALMDHPNIARVLDGGETPPSSPPHAGGTWGGGRPYFVMELVKGVPITEFCDQNHLVPEARLKLFIDVCHAIQHAHHKGVIHRDVKPSNVMVTLHEGVPVVKVIDFGVAKATVQKLTEKTLFTAYGQMIGTPAYMSPEQAKMSGLDVDTRSDVYSLGVLLYELLTGTTPLTSKRLREVGYAEMQRLIREEEAPRPSDRLSSLGDSGTVVAGNRGLEIKRLVQLLAGDLDWVVMKALDKDRNRRYGTPGNFAEDVERYLRREAILARPPSTAYKLKKFAQRNRAAVLTAAAMAVALLVGTTVATWQAVRATRAEAAEVEQRLIAEQNEQIALASAKAETKAKVAAEEERNKAKEAGDRLAAALAQERLTSYAHRIALAHREWLADDIVRAGQLLEECPADLRHWEWHYLRRLCHSEQVAFRGHAHEVTAVAFSPDGRRVVSTSWKEARVWDSATGKEIFKIAGKAGWAGGVVFSPDGNRLALAGFQTVTIHDATDGKELLSIRAHDFLVKGVAFSPDGRRLATASGTPVGGGRRTGGEVKVWDAETGAELQKFTDLPQWANAVAFSPDGKYLAAGTGDLAVVAPSEPGEVRVWDANTGKLLFTLTGHTFWVTGVAFSPDSKRLASASADRTVRVWEVPAGREALTLRGHRGWVRGVAFSPRGDRLASAGDDQVVRVWDAATGKETLSLRGHTHPVRAVAFGPDGQHLASAGGDSLKVGEVRVWDTTVDQSARTFRGHTASVTGLAFSPDSKLLASASNGMSSVVPGETLIREVTTGQVRRLLKANMLGFSAVEFSPDGTSVATAGDEGVKLWDPGTGGPIRLLEVRAFPMNGMAFSPGGLRVAAVGVDGLTVWESATGQVLHKFKAHTIHAHSVAFSPDGRRFATTSWGGYLSQKVNGVEKTEKLPAEVKVWDAESGKELMRLSGGGLGLAFSPDGTRIASGSQEGPVTVWDAGTGQVLFTLRGHTKAVLSVVFNSDGRRLATAGGDHTVKVWDALIGQEVLTLRGHDEPVVSVAFSPDGRCLASASTSSGEPGQVKVWDAAPTDR